MVVGQHDFNVEQGATTRFYFLYKNAEGNPVDLSGTTGRMQVRPSKTDSRIVLDISNTGVTFPATGSTGVFLSGGGSFSGANGFTFNSDLSGDTGTTGGIMLSLSHQIMKNTISGRHFYDFETTSSGGEVTRLIEGAFIINKEVTR